MYRAPTPLYDSGFVWGRRWRQAVAVNLAAALAEADDVLLLDVTAGIPAPVGATAAGRRRRGRHRRIVRRRRGSGRRRRGRGRALRSPPGVDSGGESSAPQGAPPVPARSSNTGKVTLTWRAAWDRGDAQVTYRIHRDGVLVTPIKQNSVEWDRPDMKYTDSVTAGSRHRSTITVSDGETTLPASPAVEATALAATLPAGEL